MGITAAHIVKDIENIAASGVAPDDFRISERQILFWVGEVRSMLISQAIQKKQDYSDAWIQTINCVDLEKTSDNCCDEGEVCKVNKSILEIPNTIEFDGNNLILSVTGLDGSVLSKRNQFNSKYKKFSKYTKNKRSWYLKDNYIYVINAPLIKKVNIIGIFEEPSDLSRFKTCDNVECWSMNSDYPVSLKMAGMITDIILKTKIYPLLNFPQDTQNDSNNPNQKVDLK